MAYSDILKLKKEEVHHEDKVFIKNLIVGSDLFAIDLFDQLNKIEKGTCKLLSNEPFNEENLKLMGPSLIRGQENIDLIKSMGIEGTESHSVFYKEMKFHKFGSRSKPMPLLWGEEIFTGPHMVIDLKTVLPVLKNESIVEESKNNCFQLTISSIEKTQPEELIDQAFWKVHCTNGTVVECENLYWGESPYLFYKYFSDKSELPNDLVEYCESTKTPCALYVHMQFDEKIAEEDKTFFFPLSFTHEWGHFIGEFEANENGQLARFVTFVDQEDNSEEDLSRKIRLLKKNLEKNFEKFSGKNYKEFVVLKDSTYCSVIDDSQMRNFDDEQEKLSFFSFNAPFTSKSLTHDNFEDSWLSSSFLTRAVLQRRVNLQS